MRKQLTYLSTVSILLFFAFNSDAQTPVSQPATKTQQAVTKPRTAPVKKWRARPQVSPIGSTTTALKTDTIKNTDLSLNGQYQFVLARSKNINGYKLVNPGRLNAVWKSVTDTLKKERRDLTTAKDTIAAQQKTIQGLLTAVKGSESSLNDTNAKIDEINFLGMSFSKGTYNTIVWVIIAVLAIALFIMIARSAKSILEAKHRTQLYEEISADYQNYKAKASEKERKLARELQDERNIIEEMRNNRQF